MKVLRRILLTILPLLLLAGGVLGYQKLSSLKKAPEKKLQKSIPQVRVAPVEQKQITLSVRGYGKVKPVESVEIACEVGGKAIEVSPKLKAGHFVDAQEILVKLDPTNYQLKVKRLQAELKTLAVKIEHLQQQRTNLLRRMNVLKENLRLAKVQKDRTSKLQDRGVASDQILDQDRQNYLELSNRLIEVENQYQLLPIEIKEIQAQQGSLQAELRQAQADLRRTIIKAPFAGRVRLAEVREGEFVSVGATLAVLDDVSAVEVPVMLSKEDFFKIGLSAEEIRYLEVKKSVAATVWSEEGQRKVSWQAKLTRVEALNEKTRTIPVVVEVKNPWGEQANQGTGGRKSPMLMSGDFCEVEIFGRNLSDVYLIPRAAIGEDNRVYIFDQGKLRISQVKVHHYLQDQAVIASGVKPPQQVILSTILFPVEGMQLAVAKEVLAK